MPTRVKKKRGFENFSSILEELLPKLPEGQKRLTSGIIDLDRFTSGLSPGHLIVVGGRPQVGKTGFALSIAGEVAAQQGRPVGVFSLESTRREVASRILAAESMVPIKAIVAGSMTQRQAKALHETKDRLRGVPLFIDSVRELSVDQLVEQATKAWEDNQLDLLIVDYVQLLRDFTQSFESRDEEFASIVRSLKHLARDLEIPVIVVSQASGKHARPPSVWDLEGAPPIAEHADLVLLLYRPEGGGLLTKSSDGVTDVIVAKDRTSAERTFQTVFLQEVGAFRNLMAPEGSEQPQNPSPAADV